MGGWEVGELESWAVGELESWAVGELESWAVGELGVCRVGGLDDEFWRLRTRVGSNVLPLLLITRCTPQSCIDGVL